MIRLAPTSISLKRIPLRLGFVPLIDCAPIAVAHELGIFKKYDVPVRISREPGWASIRDKFAYRELDVAHATAALTFALHLGIDCRSTPVSIPLILSANGNAITLRNEIPKDSIENGNRLADFFANSWTIDRKPVFAAAHRWSSHSIILHNWLNSQGITPGKDVTILYLPPPVMARNLAAGNIDGYCVGEPWNTVSIKKGYGWCARTSLDLCPDHTEKVLIASPSVTEERQEALIQLVKSLLEACEFCQNLQNRSELLDILADPSYLDWPKDILAESLLLKANTFSRQGSFETLHTFHNSSVNCPTVDKADWTVNGLRANNLITKEVRFQLRDIFRIDIYEEALSTMKK